MDDMNKPGLLMFVDFEKAFNSTEWAFIERALVYFNFGPSLVTWFKLFYNDGLTKRRLSQYANGTTLILHGSDGSFLPAVEVLDRF